MSVIPILRLFDEGATRRFYYDFLGFRYGFEYRHAPDLPLYMGVAFRDAQLHFSQHYGDCCPGGHVRLHCPGLVGFQEALLAQAFGFARPGPPVLQPWGFLELTLTDPAGNRLTFTEPKTAG